MIPGEVFPAAGSIVLNEGRPTLTLKVANSGDRPVQIRENNLRPILFDCVDRLDVEVPILLVGRPLLYFDDDGKRVVRVV